MIYRLFFRSNLLLFLIKFVIWVVVRGERFRGMVNQLVTLCTLHISCLFLFAGILATLADLLKKILVFSYHKSCLLLRDASILDSDVEF